MGRLKDKIGETVEQKRKAKYEKKQILSMPSSRLGSRIKC